ncbi:hypothetical protein LCGC14_2233930 [marine sediment metagenome]|uniref:Uncharacterized protein n=1 Tax=marine sediment metagenome TaxID=412755 RepID=A0A0F9D7M2_9ZZZZ|nr:hypothetical protein [bacterium]
MFKIKILLSKKSSTSYKFFKLYLWILIVSMIISPHLLISNRTDWRSTNPKDLINYDDILKTSNPAPQHSFFSFQIDDDNSGSS